MHAIILIADRNERRLLDGVSHAITGLVIAVYNNTNLMLMFALEYCPDNICTCLVYADLFMHLQMLNISNLTC